MFFVNKMFYKTQRYNFLSVMYIVLNYDFLKLSHNVVKSSSICLKNSI